MKTKKRKVKIRLSVKYEKALTKCRCPECKSVHHREIYPQDYEREKRGEWGEPLLLVTCETCDRKLLSTWKRGEKCKPIAFSPGCFVKAEEE